MVEDFYRYPARVATIEAAMPAEQIGRTLSTAARNGQQLWI